MTHTTTRNDASEPEQAVIMKKNNNSKAEPTNMLLVLDLDGTVIFADDDKVETLSETETRLFRRMLQDQQSFLKTRNDDSVSIIIRENYDVEKFKDSANNDAPLFQYQVDARRQYVAGSKKQVDAKVGVRTVTISEIDREVEDPDFFSFIVMRSTRALRYNVRKRPHLDNFLNFAGRSFDVAVWTAASFHYAVAIATEMFEKQEVSPVFIYTGKNVTVKQNYETKKMVEVKKLAKVRHFGYSLSRALIVDDSRHKCLLNYGNAVIIKPFGEHTGEVDLADEELIWLERYLQCYVDTPYVNVRSLDKRKWRSEVYAKWTSNYLLRSSLGCPTSDATQKLTSESVADCSCVL